MIGAEISQIVAFVDGARTKEKAPVLESRRIHPACSRHVEESVGEGLEALNNAFSESLIAGTSSARSPCFSESAGSATFAHPESSTLTEASARSTTAELPDPMDANTCIVPDSNTGMVQVELLVLQLAVLVNPSPVEGTQRHPFTLTVSPEAEAVNVTGFPSPTESGTAVSVRNMLTTSIVTC